MSKDMSSNAEPAKSSEKPVDLSGRDRLLWNTMVSWSSQLLLVISGFIMPRMIDHHIGQVALGIWDFSWGFVNYLNIMGFGIGSSVSRYVAKYRAEGRLDKLNAVVSSVALIQCLLASICVLTTVVFVYFVPDLFGDTLEENTQSTQVVLALLGLVMASQMFFDSCRGVMTGHHRWDIHNAIHAGSNMSAVAMMLVSLISGGDIIALAASYSVAMIVAEFVRFYITFKVCPDIRFTYKYFSKAEAKEAFIFGAKNIFIGLPGMLLSVSTSMLIVLELGPAMLAVYARPRALIKQIKVFMHKYTFMLMPMAGAMQTGQSEELKDLFVDTTKYAVSFTLPVLTLLVIYGDMILFVWMGEKYANGLIIGLLAVGSFLPISQDVAVRMLVGTNQHGPVALINICIVAIVYSAGYVYFSQVGWEIHYFAVLATIPLILSHGIIIPYTACKRLKVSVLRYIQYAMLPPTVLCAPFMGIIVLSRYLYDQQSYIEALVCTGVAGFVLIFCYFQFLLGESQKNKVLRILKLKSTV